MARLLFASVATMLLSAACVFATIQIPGVRFPATAFDKHQTLSPKSAVVGDSFLLTSNDAFVKGGYQVLTRSAVPENNVGKIYDINGNPVKRFASTSSSSPNYLRQGTVDDASNNPDYISFLPRRNSKYIIDAFVHFEAPRPSEIYHLELHQDPVTGVLTVVNATPTDWSAWHGLWTPCAGSVSPWNSHMGSEEYEPNALTWDSVYGRADAAIASSSDRDFLRYWGLYLNDTITTPQQLTTVAKQFFKPYRYGHATEVYFDFRRNRPVTKKWLTLGRIAWEAPLVMPDRRTVYGTDDGANVGFFKFEADTPGDLSSGTLYAAKFTQLTTDGQFANGGKFTINWIELGRATQDQLLPLMDTLEFSQIFELSTSGVAIVDGAVKCVDQGFIAVTHSYGRECLKVKPGMETAAAFFETRRYAAYLGATTEWNKWEGIDFDPKTSRLYTAMSNMQATSITWENRNGPARWGAEDIKLDNNVCGCVYALDVDASYSATHMEAITCGNPSYSPKIPGLYNTIQACHPDEVSEIDNVSVIDGHDLLLMSEDTDDSNHETPALWIYDLVTGEKTRIGSGPYGTEWTGTGAYSINGFLYLTANLQHPSSNLAQVPSGNGGWIGYFGPYKVPRGMTIGFEHVNPPVTAADKGIPVTSSKITIGTKNLIDYHVLALDGELLPGETDIPGRMLDENGDPVFNFVNPAAGNYSASPVEQISNAPDANVLVKICDRTYMTTGWEAPQPSVMYLTEVEQSKNGSMTETAHIPVDFSAWGGVWTPCSASLSPWNTRLGSEEYEPDARNYIEATGFAGQTPSSNNLYTAYPGQVDFARYFGLYINQKDTAVNPPSLAEFRDAFKPYKYGHVTEVKPNYDGTYTAVKHLLMGRVAVELGYAMPDLKTVYVTDDGTNVGFFKFVADQPMDMSSGCLYAAKFNQTSPDGSQGGTFTIEWIQLACGHAEELIFQMDRLTFNDIFETAVPSAGSCPAGFRIIHAGQSFAATCECLKVKPGMEKYAAFFETRRYANYLGATVEFNKWEGITFDPVGMKIYTAMSGVDGAMRKNDARDACGPDHVRVKGNTCGCVYALDVDENMSAYYMYPEICGLPKAEIPGLSAAGIAALTDNICWPDSIAQPDNIAVVHGHNQLLIAEDASGGVHQNDVAWLYDLETKSLIRIQTSPYGAEISGVYWYPKFDGYGYFTSIIQHPYGESDQVKLGEADSTGIAATSGVIGPFSDPLPGKKVCALTVRPVTMTMTLKFTVTEEYKALAHSFVQAKIEALLARYAQVQELTDIITRVSVQPDGLDMRIRILMPTPSVEEVRSVLNADVLETIREEIITMLTRMGDDVTFSPDTAVQLSRVSVGPAKSKTHAFKDKFM